MDALEFLQFALTLYQSIVIYHPQDINLSRLLGMVDETEVSATVDNTYLPILVINGQLDAEHSLFWLHCPIYRIRHPQGASNTIRLLGVVDETEVSATADDILVIDGSLPTDRT